MMRHKIGKMDMVICKSSNTMRGLYVKLREIVEIGRFLLDHYRPIVMRRSWRCISRIRG